MVSYDHLVETRKPRHISVDVKNLQVFLQSLHEQTIRSSKAACTIFAALRIGVQRYSNSRIGLLLLELGASNLPGIEKIAALGNDLLLNRGVLVLRCLHIATGATGLNFLLGGEYASLKKVARVSSPMEILSKLALRLQFASKSSITMVSVFTYCVALRYISNS